MYVDACLRTIQCPGGPSGARRSLPPVVLVTQDPMYEEIPASPSYDQVNYTREESTGQQKVTVQDLSAGEGKILKHDVNSSVYHTLEPEPYTDDEDNSERTSDYLQPVSSKEQAGDCNGPEPVIEIT